MEPEIKLSASIICANILNLKKDLDLINKNKFDYIHFDIMDGHFVPRIGFDTFLIKELVKAQSVPVEVHLMVTDPERYIEEIVKNGASIITFHYETGKDVYNIVQKIKGWKIKVGIALRPFTPISVINNFIEYIDVVLLMAYSPGVIGQKPILNFEKRIREVKDIVIREKLSNIDIAVDGGITVDNLQLYKKNGANFFILGKSALFVPGGNPSDQIDKINKILNRKI